MVICIPRCFQASFVTHESQLSSCLIFHFLLFHVLFLALERASGQRDIWIKMKKQEASLECCQSHNDDNESTYIYRFVDSFFFPFKLIYLFCVLSHSVVSDSLRLRELQPTRLLCPWGFSRQEYWSGLPCPPSEDLPNPGNKPRSPTLWADSLLSEPPGKPQNTVHGILQARILEG